MISLNINSLDYSGFNKNEILLHAAFQVLVNFMEEEKPGEIINWDFSPEHQHAWKEMNELYVWWKKERSNRVDPLDNVDIPPLNLKKSEKYPGFYELEPNPPEITEVFKMSGQLELDWEKEDQHNLHRLIDIRMFLWT